MSSLKRLGVIMGLFAILYNGLAHAQYSILHTFGASGDGAHPLGALTLSGSTLFGMTSDGGTNDRGVLFKIGTDGSGYQLLHSFLGYTLDGSDPEGSLTLSNSTLYGMTSTGGTNNPGGTVFSIKTDGTGYQMLCSSCAVLVAPDLMRAVFLVDPLLSLAQRCME